MGDSQLELDLAKIGGGEISSPAMPGGVVIDFEQARRALRQREAVRCAQARARAREIHPRDGGGAA